MIKDLCLFQIRWCSTAPPTPRAIHQQLTPLLKRQFVCTYLQWWPHGTNPWIKIITWPKKSSQIADSYFVLILVAIWCWNNALFPRFSPSAQVDVSPWQQKRALRRRWRRKPRSPPLSPTSRRRLPRKVRKRGTPKERWRKRRRGRRGKESPDTCRHGLRSRSRRAR